MSKIYKNLLELEYKINLFNKITSENTRLNDFLICLNKTKNYYNQIQYFISLLFIRYTEIDILNYNLDDPIIISGSSLLFIFQLVRKYESNFINCLESKNIYVFNNQINKLLNTIFELEQYLIPCDIDIYTDFNQNIKEEFVKNIKEKTIIEENFVKYGSFNYDLVNIIYKNHSSLNLPFQFIKINKSTNLLGSLPVFSSSMNKIIIDLIHKNKLKKSYYDIILSAFEKINGYDFNILKNALVFNKNFIALFMIKLNTFSIIINLSENIKHLTYFKKPICEKRYENILKYINYFKIIICKNNINKLNNYVSVNKVILQEIQYNFMNHNSEDYKSYIYSLHLLLNKFSILEKKNIKIDGNVIFSSKHISHHILNINKYKTIENFQQHILKQIEDMNLVIDNKNNNKIIKPQDFEISEINNKYATKFYNSYSLIDKQLLCVSDYYRYYHFLNISQKKNNNILNSLFDSSDEDEYEDSYENIESDSDYQNIELNEDKYTNTSEYLIKTLKEKREKKIKYFSDMEIDYYTKKCRSYVKTYYIINNGTTLTKKNYFIYIKNTDDIEKYLTNQFTDGIKNFIDCESSYDICNEQKRCWTCLKQVIKFNIYLVTSFNELKYLS